MNITTKYDIGDEVYLIDNNDICKVEIYEIEIFIADNNIAITYTISGAIGNVKEDQLFKTTKELYNHIEKEIKKLNEDKIRIRKNNDS